MIAGNWVALWCMFLQLSRTGFGQIGENSPPVLWLKRNWNIRDTDPVGEVVDMVQAYDNENDPLVFGLEPINFNGKARQLPFIINETTGVVRINESLIKRGGEQFLLYVTAFDGDLVAKSEVWVKIINSSDPGSQKTGAPSPGAPGFIPQFQPQFPVNAPGSNVNNGFSYPLPGFTRRPKPPSVPPPPPSLSPATNTGNVTNTTGIQHHNIGPTVTTPLPSSATPTTTTTTTITTTTTTATTSRSTTTTTEPPAQRNVTTVVTPATAANTTSDLAFTLVPVVILCGLFLMSGAIAWMFRKKLCRRGKSNKDDMKEPPEAMVLEGWRGPRAHSNRYEGWDRDSQQVPPPPQPPPLQGAAGTGGSNGAVKPPADRWEFPRHHLKVFNILGEGCFGQVWRCEALNIDGRDGTTVVAVKTLKENASEKERSDLVQELQVMKMLEPHPNVVRLLGCCTEKDPVFVIMEYVAGGKLQSFLRNSRAERYYGNLHGPSKTLTSRDLTSFVYQVARGMDFLSSKGIIHRDLAARNVLVGEGNICKVADFGFARDVISSHVYERKSEGRLPIRWMAPESLYDNIFSIKSDVWSFGVLIWEIVTLGSTPYPGMAAAEVMRRVRDGYRLDKPEHCRRELYNIMYYCWDRDPKERPPFHELVKLLEQLLLTETEYIELERFPDHSYYNMVSLSGEKL